MKKNAGFTLIELLMTMTVMGILLGLTTLNFTSIQRKTTLATTVEAVISDLGQQQIKAMVGDTEGRNILDNYGIHFISTGYTLFYGSYSATNSANFSVTMPTGQQVIASLPNAEVIFQKGSGDIVNYLATQSAITLRDTTTGEQKLIQLNRYGVVMSVN